MSFFSISKADSICLPFSYSTLPSGLRRRFSVERCCTRGTLNGMDSRPKLHGRTFCFSLLLRSFALLFSRCRRLWLSWLIKTCLDVCPFDSKARYTGHDGGEKATRIPDRDAFDHRDLYFYIWRSSFIEAWKNKYDSNNRTACSTTIIAVKIYFWLDEEGHTDGMRTWQRTARLMHSTGWLHDEALRQCATYLSQTHLGLGSLSH